MNKQAFTLIELLVVIAIIGILSGLIVVSMGGVTAKANIAKAQVFSNSLRNSLLADLTSEWKFDGATAAGSAAVANDVIDSWGTSNGSFCSVSGLNVHPVPIVKTGTDCIYKSCLYFDNVDDQVLTNSTFKYIGQGMTISAWIKVDPTTANESYIMTKPWNGNGYYNYYLAWGTDNKIWFWVGGTALTDTFTVSSSATVLKGDWHYITATINSDTAATSPKLMKIYIDGTMAGSGTHTISSWVPTLGGGDASLSMVIGYVYPCDQSVMQRIFHGTMDEVRFYRNSVPVSEIQQQYYSGLNAMLAKGLIDKAAYLDKINNLLAEND